MSFGPVVFRACLRKFVDIADAVMNQKDHSGIKDMLSKSEAGEYLLDGPE